MKTFYLEPTCSQKSFYKKALVIESDGVSSLKSYNTIVAEYNHETNEMRVFGWYSVTTAKHINSFLEFYGFDRLSKKEMINYKSI